MYHVKKLSVSRKKVSILCYLTSMLLTVTGCAKPQVALQWLEKQAAGQENLATATVLAVPVYTTITLLNDGNEGNNGVIYHSFRIPSIIKTNNGTLIAFAEGRRWIPSDYGDINIVFKKSTNKGSSWSACGEVIGSGPGSWTNPTAVCDWSLGANGRIWLFMEWNDEHKQQCSHFAAWGDRRIHTSYSDDIITLKMFS